MACASPLSLLFLQFSVVFADGWLQPRNILIFHCLPEEKLIQDTTKRVHRNRKEWYRYIIGWRGEAELCGELDWNRRSWQKTCIMTIYANDEVLQFPLQIQCQIRCWCYCKTSYIRWHFSRTGNPSISGSWVVGLVITLCGYQSFLSFSSLHPAFCQLLSSPQFYVWSNQSRSNAKGEVKARMAYIETDIERGSFIAMFFSARILSANFWPPLFFSRLSSLLELISRLSPTYNHTPLFPLSIQILSIKLLLSPAPLVSCYHTTPHSKRSSDYFLPFKSACLFSSFLPFFLPSFCASQAQLIC